MSQNINRRVFAKGALALGLGASCAPVFAQSNCNPVQSSFRPIANRGFSEWVGRFQSRAGRAGIQRDTLVAGFRSGGFIPDVVSRDRNQFQTRRTIEDYISIASSDARVLQGQKAMARNAKALNSIYSKYGVDPYVVAAIWGVETRFGERRGDVPVISATATLAFDGRRGAFYEAQLIAALKILQSGQVAADQMLGSWAGAMGHTQFIPTSYLAFAVDHTGDGRRDIWSNDPTDALASTAAYLARNGWRKGLAWGGEAGVTSAQGSIIQPQKGGPSFVTTRNFGVLRRYNDSTGYVLAVGHLSDRLRGAGPLQRSFPADRYGMKKRERVALQAGLERRGYDLGDIDGVIGPKTKCAIEQFQSKRGLAITGEPSQSLLRTLR